MQYFLGNVLRLSCLQIGNPLLEFNIDFNSRAEFYWSHGLISDSTYESFTSICNYSQIRRQSTSRSLTPVCSGVIRQVSREISNSIDTYDVTLDVCLPSILSQAQVLNQLVRLSFFSIQIFFFACLIRVWKLCFPCFLYLHVFLWANLISLTARYRENRCLRGR